MKIVATGFSKLIVLLLFCCLAGPVHATALKVGVYQNYPLTHVDEAGHVKGFFIDILEYAARENDWEIEYVPEPWSVCLENLKEGRIDLLGVIAYSETRSAFIDYSYESLLTEWGQICPSSVPSWETTHRSQFRRRLWGWAGTRHEFHWAHSASSPTCLGEAGRPEERR